MQPGKHHLGGGGVVLLTQFLEGRVLQHLAHRQRHVGGHGETGALNRVDHLAVGQEGVHFHLVGDQFLAAGHAERPFQLRHGEVGDPHVLGQALLFGLGQGADVFVHGHFVVGARPVDQGQVHRVHAQPVHAFLQTL